MDPQHRALDARQQLESAAIIAMTHLALLLEAKDVHPVCAGAAVLQPHRCLPYTQMQAQSESGCAKPSQHWPNRMLSLTSLQRSSLQLASLCDATALLELRSGSAGRSCLPIPLLPVSLLSSRHNLVSFAVQSNLQCNLEDHSQ